jgi:hypothetical protein
MNEDNKQLNIKDEIIKKIESGEIQMKSKWYFVLKLGILATLVFLVFVFSTFLLSYILFSLSTGGHFFLLRFGFEGLYNFFVTLPWILLVINVLLILLLDRLLKSFRFGYKSPALYLFIGTFIFVTLLSTLVNYTSFHRSMEQRAVQKKLPLGNDFYSGPKGPKPLPNSFRGFVSAIYDNTFIMSYGSTSMKVVAVKDIELKYHLKDGDLVFVAGKIVDNEIKAYGIKKLNR